MDYKYTDRKSQKKISCSHVFYVTKPFLQYIDVFVVNFEQLFIDLELICRGLLKTLSYMLDVSF